MKKEKFVFWAMVVLVSIMLGHTANRLYHLENTIETPNAHLDSMVNHYDSLFNVTDSIQ